MASTTTPVTSKELLAAVDAGWRPFRDAIGRIAPADLERPTGAGWTFRDLIAHVAAWQDLTARRLRVLRSTGTAPSPSDSRLGAQPFADADAFNARVVADHRLVEPAALLDELDATFSALRSEITQLRDEQIRANGDFAVAIVRGNTFGHYAEHATELGR